MSQKRSSTYNPQPGGHHPGGEATKREREDIQTPHRGSIPQGPSVPEKQKNADRSFLYRSTEGLMNSADGSNVSEQSRNINQRSTSKTAARIRAANPPPVVASKPQSGPSVPLKRTTAYQSQTSSDAGSPTSTTQTGQNVSARLAAKLAGEGGITPVSGRYIGSPHYESHDVQHYRAMNEYDAGTPASGRHDEFGVKDTTRETENRATESNSYNLRRSMNLENETQRTEQQSHHHDDVEMMDMRSVDVTDVNVDVDAVDANRSHTSNASVTPQQVRNMHTGDDGRFAQGFTPIQGQQQDDLLQHFVGAGFGALPDDDLGADSLSRNVASYSGSLIHWDELYGRLMVGADASEYHICLFTILDQAHASRSDISAIMGCCAGVQDHFRSWDTLPNHMKNNKDIIMMFTVIDTVLRRIPLNELPSPIVLTMAVVKILTLMNYDVTTHFHRIADLCDTYATRMCEAIDCDIESFKQEFRRASSERFFSWMMHLIHAVRESMPNWNMKVSVEFKLRCVLCLILCESSAAVYDLRAILIPRYAERVSFLRAVHQVAKSTRIVSYLNRRNPEISVLLLSACSPLGSPDDLWKLFQFVITPESAGYAMDMANELRKISCRGYKGDTVYRWWISVKNVSVVLSRGGTFSEVVSELYMPFLESIFRHDLSDDDWYSAFSKDKDVFDLTLLNYLLNILHDSSSRTLMSVDRLKCIPKKLLIERSDDLSQTLLKYIVKLCLAYQGTSLSTIPVLRLVDHFYVSDKAVVPPAMQLEPLKVLLTSKPLTSEIACFGLFCPEYSRQMEKYDQKIMKATFLELKKVISLADLNLISTSQLEQIEGSVASNTSLHTSIMFMLARVILANRLSGSSVESLSLACSEFKDLGIQFSHASQCLLHYVMRTVILDYIAPKLTNEIKISMPASLALLLTPFGHPPYLKRTLDETYYRAVALVDDQYIHLSNIINGRLVTLPMCKVMKSNWNALLIIFRAARIQIKNDGTILHSGTRDEPSMLNPTELIARFDNAIKKQNSMKKLIEIIHSINPSLLPQGDITFADFSCDMDLKTIEDGILPSFPRLLKLKPESYDCLMFFVEENCELFLKLFTIKCRAAEPRVESLEKCVTDTMQQLHELVSPNAVIRDIIKLFKDIDLSRSAIIYAIELLSQYFNSTRHGPGVSISKCIAAAFGIHEWVMFVGDKDGLLDTLTKYELLYDSHGNPTLRDDITPRIRERHALLTRELENKPRSVGLGPHEFDAYMSMLARNAPGELESLEHEIGFRLEINGVSMVEVVRSLREVEPLIKYLAVQNKRQHVERFEQSLTLLDSSQQGQTLNCNILSNLRKMCLLFKRWFMMINKEAPENQQGALCWNDVVTLLNKLTNINVMKMVMDVFESFETIKVLLDSGSGVNVEATIPFMKTVLISGHFKMRTEHHLNGQLLAIVHPADKENDDIMNEVALPKINALVAGIDVFLEKRKVDPDNLVIISMFQECVKLAKRCFEMYNKLDALGHSHYHAKEFAVGINTEPKDTTAAARRQSTMVDLSSETRMRRFSRLKLSLEAQHAMLNKELNDWQDALSVAYEKCKRLHMLSPNTLAAMIERVGSALLERNTTATMIAHVQPYIWMVFPDAVVDRDQALVDITAYIVAHGVRSVRHTGQFTRSVGKLNATCDLINELCQTWGLTNGTEEVTSDSYHAPQVYRVIDGDVHQREMELYQLLFTLNNSVPHPSNVLYCDAQTSMAEIDHFKQRCHFFFDMNFQLVHANRLAVSLRENLLNWLMDVIHSKTPLAELSLIFTSNEGSSSFVFIGLSQFKKTDVKTFSDALRMLGDVKTLKCAPLSGKTTYVRQIMKTSQQSVTVSCGEEFCVSQVLQTLSDIAAESDTRRVIHFQLSAYCNLEKFSRLMDNLLIHSYVVDDDGTGRVKYVNHKNLEIFVEIGSVPNEMRDGRTLDRSADSIYMSIPLLCMKSRSVSEGELSSFIVQPYVRSVILALSKWLPNKLPSLVGKTPEQVISFTDVVVRDCLNQLFQLQGLGTKTMYEKDAFIKILAHFSEYLFKREEFYADPHNNQPDGQDPECVMKAFIDIAQTLCHPNIDLTDNLPIVPAILLGSVVQPSSCEFFNFTGNRHVSGCIRMEFTKQVALSNPALLRSKLAAGLGFRDSGDLLPIIQQQKFVMTTDIAIKLLIMHIRKCCGMNTVLCGATGCGKTEMTMLNAVVSNAGVRAIETGLYLMPKILRDMHRFLERDVLSIANQPLPKFSELFTGTSLHEPRNNSELLMIVKSCCENVPQIEFSKRDVRVTWQYFAYRLVPLLKKYVSNHVLIAKTSAMISRLCDDNNTQPIPLENDKLSAPDCNYVVRSAEELTKLIDELLNVQFPAIFQRILMNKAMRHDDIRSRVLKVMKDAKDLYMKLMPTLTAEQINDPEFFKTVANDPKMSWLAEIRFVLFIDEFNTSSCMGLMKELMCDRSLDGDSLPHWLSIVGAMNPYVELSEGQGGVNKTGLKTKRRIYDVNNVPQSVTAIMLNFGSLSDAMEAEFLNSMFAARPDLGSSNERRHLHTMILWCQTQTRRMRDGYITATIRDMMRCVHLYSYFRNVPAGMEVLRCYLKTPATPKTATSKPSTTSANGMFSNLLNSFLYEPLNNLLLGSLMPQTAPRAATEVPHVRDCQSEHWLSLILSCAICYYLRALNKNEFGREFTAEMTKLSPSRPTELSVFNDVMTAFLNKWCDIINIPPGIARTENVKWNTFSMMICCDAIVPISIIGPPGTSKTLSFTIATDNMNSRSNKTSVDLFASMGTVPSTNTSATNVNGDLFKEFHILLPRRVQLAVESSDVEIADVYTSAVAQQRSFNSEDKVSALKSLVVVLLDEAGLPKAEPLKETHYWLDHPIVSTVMLSNETLDAALANRCVQVTLPEPQDSDYEALTMGVLYNKSQIFDTDPNAQNMRNYISALCEAFKECNRFSASTRQDMYHQRDFVYTLRQIRESSFVNGGNASAEVILRSLQRNFGGTDEKSFIDLASNFFDRLTKKNAPVGKVPSKIAPEVIKSMRESLNAKLEPNDDPNLASFRYIMVIDPTDSLAAVSLILDPSLQLVDCNNAVVINLGNFRQDSSDEAKTNVIVKIKDAMADPAGKSVILVNADAVVSSFYDLFNRHFFVRAAASDGASGEQIVTGQQCFAHIALGSISQPCEVNPNSKLILHIPLSRINRVPLPLLNRFEKYRLSVSDALNHFLTVNPWRMLDVKYEANGKIMPKSIIDIVREGVEDMVDELHVKDQNGRLFYGVNTDTVSSLIYECVKKSSMMNSSDLVVPKSVNLPEFEQKTSITKDDEASHIRQLIIKLKRIIMQLSRVESVFMCRSMPRAYVEEILLIQEHMSTIRVLKWLVKTKLVDNSPDYTNKWLIFTRSAGPVPSLHHNRSLHEHIFHDTGCSAACLTAKSLEFESSAECVAAVEEFYNDAERKLLIVIADMEKLSSDDVNYIRTILDKYSQPDKLVIILLHFPEYKILSSHSCYDVSFTNGWQFVYTDALGVTVENERLPAAHSDQRLSTEPDARTLIAKAFGLRVNVSRDSLSKKMIDSFTSAVQECLLNTDIRVTTFENSTFYSTHQRKVSAKDRADMLIKFLLNNSFLYDSALMHTCSLWSGELLHAVVMQTCENLIEGSISCGLLNAIFMISRFLIVPPAESLVHLICRDGNLQRLQSLLSDSDVRAVNDVKELAIRCIRTISFPSPRELVTMTLIPSAPMTIIPITDLTSCNELPFFYYLVTLIKNAIAHACDSANNTTISTVLMNSARLLDVVDSIDQSNVLLTMFQRDYVKREIFASRGIKISEAWLNPMVQLFKVVCTSYPSTEVTNLDASLSSSQVLNWVINGSVSRGDNKIINFMFGCRPLMSLSSPSSDEIKDAWNAMTNTEVKDTPKCVNRFILMLLWTRLFTTIRSSGSSTDMLINWCKTFSICHSSVVPWFRSHHIYVGKDRAILNCMLTVHSVATHDAVKNNINEILNIVGSQPFSDVIHQILSGAPLLHDVGVMPSMQLLNHMLSSILQQPSDINAIREIVLCLLTNILNHGDVKKMQDEIEVKINQPNAIVNVNDKPVASIVDSYIIRDMESVVKIAFGGVTGSGDLKFASSLTPLNWLSVFTACMLDHSPAYWDMLLNTSAECISSIIDRNKPYVCNPYISYQEQSPVVSPDEVNRKRFEMIITHCYMHHVSLRIITLEQLCCEMTSMFAGQQNRYSVRDSLNMAIHACAILTVAARDLSGSSDPVKVITGMWTDQIRNALKSILQKVMPNYPIDPQMAFYSKLTSTSVASAIMQSKEVTDAIGLDIYVNHGAASQVSPFDMARFTFSLKGLPDKDFKSLSPVEHELKVMYDALMKVESLATPQSFVAKVAELCAGKKTAKYHLRMLMIIISYYDFYLNKQPFTVLNEAFSKDVKAGNATLFDILGIDKKNDREKRAFVYYSKYTETNVKADANDDLSFKHFMASLLAVILGTPGDINFMNTSLFQCSNLGTCVPGSDYNRYFFMLMTIIIRCYWDCGFRVDGLTLTSIAKEPLCMYGDRSARLSIAALIWGALTWGCLLAPDLAPLELTKNYHLLNTLEDLRDWNKKAGVGTMAQTITTYVSTRAAQFFSLVSILPDAKIENFNVSHFFAELLIKLYCCYTVNPPACCKSRYDDVATAVAYEKFFKDDVHGAAVSHCSIGRLIKQSVACLGNKQLELVLSVNALNGSFIHGVPSSFSLYSDTVLKNTASDDTLSFLFQHLKLRDKVLAVHYLGDIIAMYHEINALLSRRVSLQQAESTTVKAFIDSLNSSESEADKKAGVRLNACFGKAKNAWDKCRVIIGNLDGCEDMMQNRRFEAYIPPISPESLLRTFITTTENDPEGNYVYHFGKTIIKTQNDVICQCTLSMDKMLVDGSLDISMLTDDNSGALVSSGMYQQTEVTLELLSALCVDAQPASNAPIFELILNRKSLKIDMDRMKRLVASNYFFGRCQLSLKNFEQVLLFTESPATPLVSKENEWQISMVKGNTNDRQTVEDVTAPLWQIRGFKDLKVNALRLFADSLKDAVPDLCANLDESDKSCIDLAFRTNITDSSLLEAAGVLCDVIRLMLTSNLPKEIEQSLQEEDLKIGSVVMNFLRQYPMSSFYNQVISGMPVNKLYAISIETYDAYVQRRYMYVNFNLLMRDEMQSTMIDAIMNLRNKEPIKDVKDLIADLMETLTHSNVLDMASQSGLMENEEMYGIIEPGIQERLRPWAKQAIDDTHVQLCHTASLLKTLYTLSSAIAEQEVKQIKLTMSSPLSNEQNNATVPQITVYTEKVPIIVQRGYVIPATSALVSALEKEKSSGVPIPQDDNHVVVEPIKRDVALPRVIVPVNVNQPVGIPNVGASCYLGSALQLLNIAFKVLNEELSGCIANQKNDKDSVNSVKLYTAVQSMLSSVKSHGFVSAADLDNILDTLRDRFNYIRHRQHDAGECLLDIVQVLYSFDSHQLHGAVNGLLIDGIQCQTCKKQSQHTQRSSPVVLTITKTDQSLQECIDEYFSTHAVDNYTCEHQPCDGGFALKTCCLDPPPELLFISVSKQSRKSLPIGAPVKIDTSAIYDIYGAIIHTGGVDGGHYRSVVKYNDSWFMCDDSNVSWMTLEEAGNACGDATLLLAVRSKDTQLPAHAPILPPEEEEENQTDLIEYRDNLTPVEVKIQLIDANKDLAVFSRETYMPATQYDSNIVIVHSGKVNVIVNGGEMFDIDVPSDATCNDIQGVLEAEYPDKIVTLDAFTLNDPLDIDTYFNASYAVLLNKLECGFSLYVSVHDRLPEDLKLVQELDQKLAPVDSDDQMADPVLIDEPQRSREAVLANKEETPPDSDVQQPTERHEEHTEIATISQDNSKVVSVVMENKGPQVNISYYYRAKNLNLMLLCPTGEIDKPSDNVKLSEIIKSKYSSLLADQHLDPVSMAAIDLKSMSVITAENFNDVTDVIVVPDVKLYVRHDSDREAILVKACHTVSDVYDMIKNGLELNNYDVMNAQGQVVDETSKQSFISLLARESDGTYDTEIRTAIRAVRMTNVILMSRDQSGTMQERKVEMSDSVSSLTCGELRHLVAKNLGLSEDVYLGEGSGVVPSCVDKLPYYALFDAAQPVYCCLVPWLSKPHTSCTPQPQYDDVHAPYTWCKLTVIDVDKIERFPTIKIPLPCEQTADKSPKFKTSMLNVANMVTVDGRAPKDSCLIYRKNGDRYRFSMLDSESVDADVTLTIEVKST